MKSVFIDSNIWIYGISDKDLNKRNASVSLLKNEDTRHYVSVQVVNEVCYTLKKKYSSEENFIRNIIQSFYEVAHVLSYQVEYLAYSSELRERYSLSFWDSLIVSSTLQGNCETLYTEDMQHGLVIDQKLSIVNPFV